MKISRRVAIVLPFAVIASDADAQEAGLQRSLDGGGRVTLPAGTYSLRRPLVIRRPVVFEGANTVLQCAGNGVEIDGVENVILRGLQFSTQSRDASLLNATNASRLRVEQCGFEGGSMGVRLQGCSGVIESNTVSNQRDTGIFSNDAAGLEIASNTVSRIGNNGIQVWRSAKGEDGTRVHHNQISQIAANDGGSGQNGNGINVFRAGNVIVSQNRITGVAYSGVRNNGGPNVQIVANSVSRAGEVAIYVEFEFDGVVVSNNVLEDVGFGISVTNFDVGGRMATVSGNIIRRARGSNTEGVKAGGGIFGEADTVIANNIIEDARDFGIGLGWGDKCRNLIAQGNLIRETPRGVVVSVTAGAGGVRISGNQFDAVPVAIEGRDYEKVVTDDLLKSTKAPPGNVFITR